MCNYHSFDALIKDHKNGLLSNEDLYERLLLFKENDANLDDERKFLVYLNLSKFLSISKKQNLDKALNFNKEAETRMNKSLCKYAADLFHDQGHIYARMGNYLKSKESFFKYIYYQHKDDSKIDINAEISKINSNSRIIEFEDSFYSFRTINIHLLSDLINQEITVANPSEFNDPFDPLLFKFLDFRRKKIQQESGYDIKSQNEAYEYVKIRCFVRDKKIDNDRIEFAYKSNLMWAHYADSYKGICIRYRFAPIIKESQSLEKEFCCWRDVMYKEKQMFEDKASANTELLFATKNESWKYENEVRLIHFNADCETKYTQVPLSKIGGKIEAVFFGLRCPEIDKEMIKSILGNEVEYLEFKEEITANTIIDNLELINPEAFDKLDKQSKISYKMI